MKKTIPANEVVPPLPKDKPATYGNTKKSGKTSAARHDRGPATIKSDKDSPQKTREKLEHDDKKTERDPGMSER